MERLGGAGACDDGSLTGDVTPDRVVSRDGRPEEVGVPEGRRRRGVEGSRGEAIVDMLLGCGYGEAVMLNSVAVVLIMWSSGSWFGHLPVT